MSGRSVVDTLIVLKLLKLLIDTPSLATAQTIMEIKYQIDDVRKH